MATDIDWGHVLLFLLRLCSCVSSTFCFSPALFAAFLKAELRPRLVQGPWCNTPPALKHTVSSSGCGLLPIKATTSPLLKVWRRTRIAPASNPRSEPSRVRSPRVKNTPSQLLNNTRALNNGLHWDETPPGRLCYWEPLVIVIADSVCFTNFSILFLKQRLKLVKVN